MDMSGICVKMDGDFGGKWQSKWKRVPGNVGENNTHVFAYQCVVCLCVCVSVRVGG